VNIAAVAEEVLLHDNRTTVPAVKEMPLKFWLSLQFLFSDVDFMQLICDSYK
jgi:hypothetical protein